MQADSGRHQCCFAAASLPPVRMFIKYTLFWWLFRKGAFCYNYRYEYRSNEVDGGRYVQL